MHIKIHSDGYQASSNSDSEKIFGKGQRKVPSPFFTGVSTFYAHAGLESHLVLFIGLMCCGPRPVQRRVGSDLLAKTCCQPCDPQHTFAHPLSMMQLDHLVFLGHVSIIHNLSIFIPCSLNSHIVQS